MSRVSNQNRNRGPRIESATTSDVSLSDSQSGSFFDEQYFDELLHREGVGGESDDLCTAGSTSESTSELTTSFVGEPHYQDEGSLGIDSGLNDMNEIDNQYFGRDSACSSMELDRKSNFDSILLQPNLTHDAKKNKTKDDLAEYLKVGRQTSGNIRNKTRDRFQEKGLLRNSIAKQSHGIKENANTWYRITSSYRSDTKLNIFQRLIADLNNEPSYNVIDFLLDSQVYHDEDILVINKPYKLICQGSQADGHSLIKYLPEIADRLKLSVPLYLCHRLDRDTTGLVVVAKGPESHARLNQKFANWEIEKRYKCITKGVPSNDSGVIDLPLIMDGKVGGAYLTVPVTTKTRSKDVEVLPAETHYKVECTDRFRKAALLTVHPFTGRKHQIRVHLASALRTPIIGDHKYSNPVKHSPQKLSDEILRKFRITTQETRNIPMFLHAERLTIPSYFKSGGNLNLQASLPFHFSKAIKVLKLKF